MKYSVISLGCKVNQAEGEDIAAGLRAAGMEPAGKGEAADVIIVNTCTVTVEADRKSRKAIYQAIKRRTNEAAQVIVTGCYASVAAELLGKIDGVALVVGQAEKPGLVEQLLNLVSHEPGAASREVEEENSDFRVNERKKKGSSPLKGGGWKVGVRNTNATRPPTPAYSKYLAHKPQGRGNSLPRVRAFLKVQDGCDNRCAYCIVPDARGNPVSVPEGEVLRRAAELAAGGAREIVLTGINVGKYGTGLVSREPRPGGVASSPNNSLLAKTERRDIRSTCSGTAPKDKDSCLMPRALCLTGLIQKVMEVPGVARVRVSSIEPEDVTLDLIRFLADARNDSKEGKNDSKESQNESLPYLCPHLHIPLQAGDNRTLKRMGRRYVTGEFLRLVNSIRHANPDAAITTDLIVGFPGETDEEFANTMRFLDQVRPSRIHVFQYSERAGTPAADMPDQVPEPIKAARSRLAREAGERYAAEYRATFHGREVDVLVERVQNGIAVGTSENYMAVSFPAFDSRTGDIITHRMSQVHLSANASSVRNELPG